MQQVNNSRIDPAPSRWSYRMQRLMLTPLFRLVLRVGVPFTIALGGATYWFSDQEHRDQLNLFVGDMRAMIEERPEFMVKLMAIDGASDAVSDDIRAILPIDFPVSSFDLDLDNMRLGVSELDAVQSVSIRIRQGGVLQVDVVERAPVVIWRSAEGLELLDDSGARVAPVMARGDRPELPVIAGAGANEYVQEAMRLMAAAHPLRPRVRGLVRMGERRWDVVLDRNQRIQLPEQDPVRALQRVMAMDKAEDMLARDIAVLDLRLKGRPTVRLTNEAVEELWRIKSMSVESGN